MRKCDVKKLIDLKGILELAKDKDINKYLSNLANCRKVLRDIESSIDKKITNIHSQYYFCNKCNNAIKKSTAKYLYRTEIRDTLVYSDPGYGDNRYADCEFTIKYIKCPKCGNELTIDNIKGDLIPGTERDKYGNIYN
jgi:hypothetical protein